jgi:hypothetical protein
MDEPCFHEEWTLLPKITLRGCKLKSLCHKILLLNFQENSWLWAIHAATRSVHIRHKSRYENGKFLTHKIASVRPSLYCSVGRGGGVLLY